MLNNLFTNYFYETAQWLYKYFYPNVQMEAFEAIDREFEYLRENPSEKP